MRRARTIGSGMAAVAAFVAVVALAGCGSSGGSSAGSTTSSPSRSTSTTSTSTSTSTTSGPATGATTSWRDDTARWKQLVPAPISKSPQLVAEALAAAYRGGDTSAVGQVSVARVGTGEPLVVTLAESGVSDTVLSREIEITLEPGDEGWAVSSARVRDRCVQVDAADPAQCA
jgi:hypothetical protein